MRSFKKIMIIPILALISTMFISCEGDKSILLNDYYLNLNWDNNYEEISIKADQLDKSQFEIKEEEYLISIMDKKIESLDKIEFKFDTEDRIEEVKFRSNSKNIKATKATKDGSIYFFYIDEDTMVNNMDVQCDFLNGKTISDDKIIKLDMLLLNLYSTIDNTSSLGMVEMKLTSFEDDIYKYDTNRKDGNINYSLTNINTNSKVTISYQEIAGKYLYEYPIVKFLYENEDGKKIEANLENQKIESFKIYNIGDFEGQDVSTLASQVEFLKKTD